MSKEETPVTAHDSIEEKLPQLKPITGTKSFVFMDTVKHVLDVSMITRKNLILFGKGGYGKSEFTMDYLKEHNIDPYVITMGTGMTTDRLFGGLDLKTFNDTGKIEYLVENSFMNHEYVIFEELFDAPDFILEQLKDILSSGIFRNGGQQFEIKTEVIVCCTNKTREEFAKNASLRALMERFPLEQEVKWSNYNRITYSKLLETKLGFADPMLTYILECYAQGGHTISPRIAIVAATIIDKCGPECLTFIAEFNAKPEILKVAISKFSSIMEIDIIGKEIAQLADKFKKLKLTDTAGIKAGNDLNKEIFSQLTKLKSIKADDSLVASTTELRKKYEKIYEDNKRQLELLVHVMED